ncbi:adenylyl-sulfate kinase [Bacillus sp. J33]|uniref:adenylyl-sulfate kinase n=1 Tax=Bacillus sp. J33 TaxID=935836 RepID=UPI00047940B3|nr:adenylyl-sulfate kinase [Bacillus sp. J33]
MNSSDKDIKWHPLSIQKNDRNKKYGHKSCILWFTGLSGSGKSTIANALQRKLFAEDILVYLLDGDNLRYGINKNLTFHPNDRKENIRRTAEIGRLFVDAGLVVLASLISPSEMDRGMARELFEPGDFIEIYVECPLKECEKRDPKGLYKKARNGEIQQFTGIDQPYEEPENPEIIINTDTMTISECVKTISSYLFNKYKLRG